jgi:hypothetical protein
VAEAASKLDGEVNSTRSSRMAFHLHKVGSSRPKHDFKLT